MSDNKDDKILHENLIEEFSYLLSRNNDTYVLRRIAMLFGSIDMLYCSDSEFYSIFKVANDTDRTMQSEFGDGFYNYPINDSELYSELLSSDGCLCYDCGSGLSTKLFSCIDKESENISYTRFNERYKWHWSTGIKRVCTVAELLNIKDADSRKYFLSYRAVVYTPYVNTVLECRDRSAWCIHKFKDKYRIFKYSGDVQLYTYDFYSSMINAYSDECFLIYFNRESGEIFVENYASFVSFGVVVRKSRKQVIIYDNIRIVKLFHKMMQSSVIEMF